MARHDGRSNTEIRPIKFIKSPQRDPEGSVMIEWGDTKVICSCTVDERKPKWMSSDDRRGWITAEYSMLPGCSDQRINRERVLRNGRTQEIQRLIGRSLRACVKLKDLGLRTFQLDCDVIQADGGTRVASITGSYLAFRLALQSLIEKGLISKTPESRFVAGISVGRVKGEICADLDYPEDSTAEVDANIVMDETGNFLEVQGTAEKGSFSREELDTLLDSAGQACEKIFEMQRATLKEWGL